MRIVVGMSSVLFFLLACGACGEGAEGPSASVLRLATTTSTRDSGLLDVLVPRFEEQARCRVDVVAVGTGAALDLGAAGDADAVLVHAEAVELDFMEAGHGVRREPLMHNGFVLLGPAADGAGARGRSIGDALARIANGKHRFASRGDDSGTHERERLLWDAAGTRPDWKDYLETGRGMGDTLVMASELQAYVLADEATWWKLQPRLELEVMVAGGAELRNPYAVMVVNPERTGGDGALAQRLADFLVSREAQEMIRDHEVGGRRLFHPSRLEH